MPGDGSVGGRSMIGIGVGSCHGGVGCGRGTGSGPGLGPGSGAGVVIMCSSSPTRIFPAPASAGFARMACRASGPVRQSPLVLEPVLDPSPLLMRKAVRSLSRSLIALSLAAPAVSLSAQRVDPHSYAEMRWRMIGPFRASRTKAAVGIPDQPNVFYIGAVNGGVWKTTDYGRTWNPIFDDEPSGSIGAIAIAPSSPSIVYVGSGEGLQRPDLSTGDG